MQDTIAIHKPLNLMNIKHQYKLNHYNSLFESFFPTMMRNEIKLNELTSPIVLKYFEEPQIQFFEEDTFLSINVMVPGWTKNELKLDASENFLTLIGVPLKRSNAEKHELVRNLDLKIKIPHQWNLTKVSAKLEDGILKLKIPRKVTPKKKTIKIN